jgi:hypothetical protein
LEVVERGKCEGMELEWLPVVGTETVGVVVVVVELEGWHGWEVVELMSL